MRVLLTAIFYLFKYLAKITEVRHIRSQLGTALETLYERLDFMRNSSAIVKPHSIHPVPDLVDTELSRSLDSVITRVGPTFIAAGMRVKEANVEIND